MKFTNILYINLDNRKDRLEHVISQLELIGVSGERFPAIKLKNGRCGCSMSHLKCIQLAKERNWEHVFVCEDDITFTKPKLFLKQLDEFLKSKLKWDVIIVAGNNVPPHQQFGDFCIKVQHCQTTTGYIVKKAYYDTLMKNFREGINHLMREQDGHIKWAIDKNWTKLQKIDKWYMIIPASVIQKPDYSDIEGHVTDYQWHLLDIHKTKFLKMRKAQFLKKKAVDNLKIRKKL